MFFLPLCSSTSAPAAAAVVAESAVDADGCCIETEFVAVVVVAEPSVELAGVVDVLSIAAAAEGIVVLGLLSCSSRSMGRCRSPIRFFFVAVVVAWKLEINQKVPSIFFPLNFPF
jgi:hypothetical protein